MGTQPSPIEPLPRQPLLAGRPSHGPEHSSLYGVHPVGQPGNHHQRRQTSFLLSPDASPRGHAASTCFSPEAGLGKTGAAVPCLVCTPPRSLPDRPTAPDPYAGLPNCLAYLRQAGLRVSPCCKLRADLADARAWPVKNLLRVAHRLSSCRNPQASRPVFR